MLYENTIKLSDYQFRRLTGVKRFVFNAMLEVLIQSREKVKCRGGRKNTKLSLQDQLLLMLEYWRENRTYFHLAQSRSISESQAWKIVRFCENSLIKSSKFNLKGKKSLFSAESSPEIILIDATETPIERPKKNRNNIIQERKNDIPLKHKLSLIK